MAAVTSAAILFLATAPAPAAANPPCAPPATAAEKAPTKASIDWLARAVKVRPPVALTLEFTILARTSAQLGFSSSSNPIRFRAREAPIDTPTPPSLPTPKAREAPISVAEISGCNTVKWPLPSFVMIRVIPVERSVTDHSTPVSSLVSLVPWVFTLRMVTSRSSGSVDNDE